MIISVSEQVLVFLSTAICGMVIAFVYDIFRIFRKAVRTGSLVTFVQDILYWLIASVIMFITIYHSNDGELRGFLFFGAFLGVILYALMFSRVIMNSSLFIIRITTIILKFIAFIISYPFRIIVKLIAAPVCRMIKKAANSARDARATKKEAETKETVKKENGTMKIVMKETIKKEIVKKPDVLTKIFRRLVKKMPSTGNNKELK